MLRKMVFWSLVSMMAVECKHRVDDFMDLIVVNTTTRLTSLTVNPVSDDIYVGGKGLIVHLNKDLNLLSEMKFNTGFFNSSKHLEHRLDGDISLLLVQKNKRQLLVCSVFENGLCSWHQLKNVSKFKTLNPSQPTNYLGSNSTVVVFPTNGNCRRCIFVVKAINGYGTNDFISTRKVNKYNLAMAYDKIMYGDHQYSGLKVDNKIKYNVFLKPIYGFQWRKFSYFLMLQENPHSRKIETKLARICTDDRQYYSYVEIKLNCRHLKDIFNTGTAAHMSGGFLYISIVSSDMKNYGSSICVYSIPELDNVFKQTNVDCFKFARGHQPFWMSETPSKCMFNYADVKASERANFCGRPTQHGISGSRYVTKTAFYHTESIIQSLVSLTQSGERIIVLGTTSGFLRKVFVTYIPGRNQEYGSILASGDKDVAIQNQMALVNRTYLYALAGNKIIKFNVKSCSVHVNCHMCLTSGDPIGCGWCVDQCLSKENCRKSKDRFSNNTCPPVVYSITPTDGPTFGGTLVTINGNYFGLNDTLGVRPVKHNIKIAGSPCLIQYWCSSSIICRTSKVEGEVQGILEVYIRDKTTSSTRPYLVDGTSYSTQVFQFKNPSVLSYFPTYGPVSGGTLLTIRGRNLNIGGNKVVNIGETPCIILRSKVDEMICETQKVSMNFSHMKYQVDDEMSQLAYSIDGLNINLGTDPVFEYRPNPVVNDISPKRTFLSGGVLLTVYGSNLDSVAEPSLTFLNGTRIMQPCRVQSGGDEMSCKIPPKPIGMSPNLKLHFVLDGAIDEWTPCKTMTYFSDPVIFDFDEENKIRVIDVEDETSLIISGTNLSSMFSTNDVMITIGATNCTVTSVTENYIKCSPVLQHIDNDTIFPVEIIVGNLNFSPGYVTYKSIEEISLLWCLFLPVPVIIIIVIIVVAAVKCKTIPAEQKQKVFMKEQCMVYRIPDIIVTTPTSEDLRKSLNSLDDLDTKSFDRFTSSTLTLFEKDNLLIERQHIVIEEEIGRGYFGCVYKGKYLSPESDAGTESIDIAIKTLKQKSPDERELNIFLEEALIMKDFCHENVLKLIGVCLEEDTLPYVILPFMKNGDLLSYIRSPKNTPTIKNLILFAVDIAKGMDYLSRLRFVHRDLAARNCMLDANLKVKVADFGLTRDVYQQQYYSCKDHRAKLPIKWMAVESIESGTFTSMSDVWSYGILLWELMTRGVNPYSDVDIWDMLKYLQSGRRLPRPGYCPEELFMFMEKCWKPIPVSRPSFLVLLTEIPIMLEDLERAEESFKFNYVNLDDIPKYHYKGDD